MSTATISSEGSKPAQPAKRTSRTARAAQLANGSKPAASKSTGKKPAAKPVPPAKQPKGPGPNEQKNKIAAALIEFAGEQFVTAARAEELGVDLEMLSAEVGRTLSYAPGSAWHASLTSPGTGRGQRHQLAG